MTPADPQALLGQAQPTAFAGPIAPRCRRPLRWSLLAGVLSLAALFVFHYQKIYVGPAPSSFHCQLRLGPEEFAGLTIIGDLHGDYTALLELLRHAGLIPPAHPNETAGMIEEIVGAARDGNDLPAAAACSRWRGSPGHTLVQLGDNVDRGPGSAAVIACLRSCQVAAHAAGGKVVRLVGNHELMWFQGAFRYAHDTGDPPHARRRLVSNWTDEVLAGHVRGAWATGPILFVHAGLRPAMLDRLMLRGFDGELGFTSLPNATLASRVADRISVALAAAVGKCARSNETTATARRHCLTLSDRNELFSAGPDRRGRGLGGPFWTDWSVLRRAAPTTSWMASKSEFDQWIWPPARVTRGTDAISLLEPSESNTFIQIVGHTPARCNARHDERCEPIRARSDLAAVVADAGISEHYGGNRAYVTILPEMRHHLVSVTKGPEGKWRRHDFMAVSCDDTEDQDGPISRAASVAADEFGTNAGFAGEPASSAIPLGPG